MEFSTVFKLACDEAFYNLWHIPIQQLMLAIPSEKPSFSNTTPVNSLPNIPTPYTVENSNNPTSTNSPVLATSSLVAPINSLATSSHLVAATSTSQNSLTPSSVLKELIPTHIVDLFVTPVTNNKPKKKSRIITKERVITCDE